MLLRIEHLSKSYGGKPILKDITFSVSRNETVALSGPSGVGKSTLFNVISGLILPDEGKVVVNGVCTTGKTGHVNYLYQKDLLLPFRTVLENIAIPLYLQGITKKCAHEMIMPYIEDFGLLGSEGLYPAQLSGGMRQRVSLLRAFMCEGELFLLDEPFSALDAITRSHMQSWFFEMKRKFGMTTVFVTHDIDEAVSLSDRIIIIGGSPCKIISDIKNPRNGMSPGDLVLSNDFARIKKTVSEQLCIACGKSEDYRV